MLKYRGQYRVCYERDIYTGKIAEFTFIPCKIRKGANICRYNNNTLSVYIPGFKIACRSVKDYSKVFRYFQRGDGEATLLFNENKFPEAVKILKPYVKGKNISPRSNRNKRFA